MLLAPTSNYMRSRPSEEKQGKENGIPVELGPVAARRVSFLKSVLGSNV